MTPSRPVWPRPYLMAQLGLDIDHVADHIDQMVHDNRNRDYVAGLLGITPGRLSRDEGLPIVLAEADIDPRTGGAVAVASRGQLDIAGNAHHLTIEYWRKRPGGGDLLQKLIEIEPLYDGDNVTFKSIHVLGRSVDLHNVASVNRVLEAARQINLDLREGKMPPIARIFKDTYIDQVVGENLPITGLDAGGGFDFAPANPLPANPLLANPLIVPPYLAQALFGRGVNTLDPHQVLGRERSSVAADPHSGVSFASHIMVAADRHHIAMHGQIKPIASPVGTNPQSIPDLFSAEWRRVERVKGDRKTPRQVRLDSLRVLDENLSPEDERRQMQSIGVIHDITKSLRRRRFPKVMDYLTEHDLLGLVDPLDKPPPLEQGGRFYMVSLQGNGRDEILEDFGDQIGATKMLVHEGLRPDGTVDRVAVGHDLGMFLPREGSSWSGAVPDVVDWLPITDHWFITHRHLDHAHAIPIYARKGLLQDKIFHATPDVVRAIEKALTINEVDKKHWPRLEPLTEQGFFHIEKDGVRRISVEYAPQATPHSARTTPFRYIGRYGSQIAGSYLNPGDMRFGRSLADDSPVDSLSPLWIDRDFFRRGMRGLAVDDPSVDPRDVDRQDTLCDFDVTAIRRRGWAPTEPDVEENLVELSGIFADKGLLMAQISTNDSRFETCWRLANRTGRHQLEMGHFLEETARTLNVLGINGHLQPVDPADEDKGGHIQKYGDWFFQERLTGLRQNWATEKQQSNDPVRRETLENSQFVAEWMIDYHAQILAPAPPHKRYEKQLAGEQALADLIAEKNYQVDSALPRHFGAIHVGRTSKTAGRIATGAAGRRLVLVTGTQGNLAESESQLAKILKGRSHLDADPAKRTTARPLSPTMSPDDNIIVISQIAIPGNEKNQQRLVDRLVRDRNFTVVVAVHQGFEIYNPRPVDRQRLTDHYQAQNVTLLSGAENKITVLGRPLHAPGHGYDKDVEAFARLINPDIAQPQHISDPEAVNRSLDLFSRFGLGHAGRIFENFEAINIQKGADRNQAKAEPIGRFQASLVVFRLMRKFRSFFGGHLETKRLVSTESFWTEQRQAGLMASGGGVVEANFPVIDPEWLKKRRDKSRAPHPANRDRSPVMPPRRDRGPKVPPKISVAGGPS